eukprot:3096954-Rhodomonas_salina.4
MMIGGELELELDSEQRRLRREGGQEEGQERGRAAVAAVWRGWRSGSALPSTLQVRKCGPREHFNCLLLGAAVIGPL